jgi:hypothetical protein
MPEPGSENCPAFLLLIPPIKSLTAAKPCAPHLFFSQPVLQNIPPILIGHIYPVSLYFYLGVENDYILIFKHVYEENPP